MDLLCSLYVLGGQEGQLEVLLQRIVYLDLDTAQPPLIQLLHLLLLVLLLLLL